MKNNFDSLYKKAMEVISPRKLSVAASCGQVGAALLTDKGNIYTGICIDCACGLGFCAEHAAVAEMLKNGESRIIEVVAIDSDGKAGAPCGRCRELILQINPENKNTLVYISKTKTKSIEELLPDHWY